jgi:hypothetical protein
MARIISVHEYDLTPGSGPAQFEQAIRAAEGRDLFDLPGLIAHHFVRGVKGARNGAYAAVWIYESREAWERLWGTVEQPRAPREYPEKWRIWEEELMAPILSSHPDAIKFTTYEELLSGA